MKLAKGVLEFKLGVNYFDCEEFYDAEKHLGRGLQLLEELPLTFIDSYLNLLQDLYNHLGITHCNRGKNDSGLPYLEKASTLYKKAASD